MTGEQRSDPAGHGDGVTRWSIGASLVGFAVALFGVYWDDAWHTDRGRDELLSPPHLALYLGVTVAVAVVAWWGWSRRDLGLRRVGSGPIGVAIVGAAVTLGSAPVDEWWHTTFGRDAVLWSPPHLVALVGTVALGSGVALVAGGSRAATSARTDTALLVATGAGVLGAWQVLVLEYDTDVAQFSPAWYLPVLAVALVAASSTVHAALGDRIRWAAGWAGAAYTLAMIAVISVLSATDFSTPIVPAVLPALIVTDLVRQRGWALPARAAAIVIALFGVYVPYLRWVDGGVSPSLAEGLWGAAIAGVGAAVTLAVLDPTTPRIPPLTPATVVAAIVLATAPMVIVGDRPADAHDPGQGPAIVGISLMADVMDGRVRLTATPDDSGADLEPVRLVARRAGRLIAGSLSQDGSVWSGVIDLDPHGRWFVYVEALRGAERLEAWLPVTAGSDETTTKRTELYVLVDGTDATAAQVAAGVVLVLVALGIVGRVAATVRAQNTRQRRSPIAEPR